MAIIGVQLPRTAWCSPANPQPGCSPLTLDGEGVAKPMTGGALDLFRALQVAANRVASVRNLTMSNVDGRLGKKTRLLVNGVMSADGGRTYANTDDLAADAYVVESTMNAAADRMGAKVASQISMPQGVPSVPSTKTPGLIEHPGVLAANLGNVGLGFLASPIVLMIAAGGGYYAYTLYKKKPKQLPKGKVS